MTARAEALEALRPLTGDGYVRITAVLLTAAAVPYVAPLLPAASMPGYSRWSDVPLLVVSILAFQAGLRSMGDPRLRRAWTLFSAALAAWLAARLVQVGWDTNAFQHAGHGLIEDVLYALFYLFFVLALESVPRQEGEQEPVASLRKLRSTGAAVFALGLLVYFVVLPGILNPTAYRTQVPSLLLFVTLDFYIVGRLVAHRLRSPRPPCSTAYTLLVVTAVLWALTDLAEVLEYLGWWSSAPGTAVELAWLPAWLTLVSAARAPYALPQHGDAARIPGASSAGPWPGTLMLFAVSVPVAHLAFTDVMDPISQPARRLWALLVTLVLAGLAVAYEVFLHRENARLVADRDAVARRLHGLQRVEAIGRLAGGIAHDFNNLLTIILSNAGLIDTALKGGRTNVQEDLDELTAAARRGTTLVKKLLGVGRRDLLVFRPVDVGEVVRGFFPALRRIVRPSIEMRLEVEEGLGPARADAGAVEQILMNLVANASDAMPHGGVLNIGVSRGSPDGMRDRDSLAAVTALVSLTVADSGVGMDERTRDRVFEPFFTTKPAGEGTGLGLAMVYGLTKQHGGWVDVTSAPNRGTRVRVLLPAWTEGAAPDAVPGQERSQASPAILVVDDEAPIRRAAQRSLERLGYRVLVAQDGEDALRKFEASAGEISLVVTDLVMPRLSGMKLREAVERLRPGTRFIFTSGYAASDLPAEHGLDPRVPFLSKPWTMEELTLKVQEAIGPP